MSILINRDAKKYLTILALILLIWILINQVMIYMNSVQLRNEMAAHDYRLAGYLAHEHPELASKIQAVFTADKTEEQFETGKRLLEKAGYRKNIELHLLPQVHQFYKINTVIGLLISIVFSAAILLLSFLFLRLNYKKIDRLSDGVSRIMSGDISTRLDDNDEGSLPKLAASINMMTSSLYTHIEKEKQSRVFLKDILANVSHQLKTPLSALVMYAEIMKEEGTDNQIISGFLNKTENELERMQSLITNLLKLAKLDAGVIELNKSKHIMKDIAFQAAESFRTRLEKEEKNLEIKAQGTVSYNCDREWLLEALSNLIKNAIEHTAKGSFIEVVIEEMQLMIKIAVSDNGEGIHPDDINHVFKRFYRSRFSQNKQGTGIGLSLAKGVVEMHGGFISVESAVGKGTVFTVYLPKLTEL